MDISYFHRYNRLVRRGVVKPLAHGACGNEYVLRATDDAEPVLQCVWCNTLTQPGLAEYNRIKAVVKEHFE
jgi:hypothetical protein